MQKNQKDSSKKVLSGLVLFSDSARRQMNRCGMAAEDVAVAKVRFVDWYSRILKRPSLLSCRWKH